jgi:hypothetical protein
VTRSSWWCGRVPGAVVLAAAALVLAGVGAASVLAPGDRDVAAQGPDGAPPFIYMPLGVSGWGMHMLPRAATAVPPTPTPSITPTPSVTPTPTITPTPTWAPCKPLAERVRVTDIDVAPAAVKITPAGWGGTSPLFLAPAPGGGARVAWSDTDGLVHVTTLDASDRSVTADVTVAGDEVRGLVVHADGVALTVIRGENVHLVRLDATGGVVFDVHLIGGASHDVAGSKWVDGWGHEGRLVWSGETYGLYLGHTQQFGGATDKHQGDLLWFFDAQGKRVDQKLGWDWGCSHSLDLRLAHNGTRFGPVCLSDAYPSKGFHFNHTSKVRAEPSGDMRGYSAADLGGWVPLEGGFLMSFSSPEGRTTSDVGMIRVGNDGKPGQPMWLTSTAGVEESAPHLARYGDALLAGWTAGESHLIARVDQGGKLIGDPVAIDARIADRDDFVPMPGGDVAWAYAWDDLTRLRVVRITWCEPREPF